MLYTSDSSTFNAATELFKLGKNTVVSAQALVEQSLLARRKGQHEVALALMQQATAEQPERTDWLNNLGVAYCELKAFAKAEASFTRALQLNTHDQDALWNLSTLALKQKQFAKGWQSYGARKYSVAGGQQVVAPTIPRPQWQGQLKPSESLFIWPEQGIGDQVMFASCFVDLNRLVEREEYAENSVMIACDIRLYSLFKRSFPYLTFIPTGEEPLALPQAPNWQCGYGDLPQFFRQELGDFDDASFGYLKADANRVEDWRNKLAKFDSVVGITWRGGRKGNDFERCLALDELEVFRKTKAHIVSLQYQATANELEQLSKAIAKPVLTSKSTDRVSSLDDYFALLAACHHIVSVDCAVAHFAGAIGVPANILLPYNADWRWSESTSSSYWYNSLNLMRQTEDRTWQVPLQQAADQVTSFTPV